MPLILLLLVGLSHLVQVVAASASVDPADLLRGFFPISASSGGDPLAAVERLLQGIIANRGNLSLVAVPTFIWFSTRLFAGVRTALNEVFDVSARPAPPRHFLMVFLRGKLRDIAMVIATVLLFLANTLLTAAVALLQTRGPRVVPELAFFVSTAGRLLTELLAFLFSVSLFLLVYKYASARRLPWRTALLAAGFAAVMFEVAKRLYGFYLANATTLQSPVADANLGAIALFVLWIYYTAIVFLLGGVVGETWELRKMQRRQRAILQ